MNQIWKRLIFAAGILLLMAGSAFWTSRKQEHVFSDTIHIIASEYPGEPYYADLLVQLPAKDPLRIADSGVRPDGTAITADSEIFRYDQDDFVSASLHYGYAERIVISEQQNPGRLQTDLVISGDTRQGRGSKGKDFRDIPAFRIAYVSREGEILGITDTAEERGVMNNLEGYPFEAKGSYARFTHVAGSNINLPAIVILLESLLLIVVVFPFMLIIRRIRRKHEQRALIRDIQARAEQTQSKEP